MTQFNTTELDFDQIKANLKTHFLRTDGPFKDWDFEGSGLSSLLDVLAYNTHYNAVNAHMSMNESFLDSAQLRANVVSRAKLLGYTPSSNKASVAKINLTLTKATNSTAVEYTLKRGTRFTTVLDDVTYTFQTISDVSVALTDTNKFVFNNLDIYQGGQRTVEYPVDNSSYQKFTINYANVDTSTLTVKVLNGPDDLSPDTYTKFQTFTDITSASQIYFLNENGEGYYDVTFGNNIIGKSPNSLDIVQLDFLTTDGEVANGASSFTYVEGADNTVQDSGSITLVTKAQGGGDKETISSIKFNAPLTFISQNRAVTAEDYKTIIKQNINNVGDVAVWGGENNDIPNFGEVNIAIRPLDISQATLTDAEKKVVKAFLDDRKVVSIQPVLRDPLYTYLYFEVFFKYTLSLTTKSKTELETIVRNAIDAYNTTELNNFYGVFRYSPLLKVIDNSDASIVNSNVRVYAYKELPITVTGAVTSNPNIDFEFEIDGKVDQTHSMISSDSWTYDGSAVQLGDGKIAGDTEKRRVFIFQPNADGTVTNVQSNAGFLYPATGKITLSNLVASATTTIKVKVRPASNDVVSKRRTVLNISLADTTVSGDIDSSTSGTASTLSQYETVSRNP